MENNELVQKCMIAYGASSVKSLAKIIAVPYTTLNRWDNGEQSLIGELLLNTLVENKKLKDGLLAIIKSEEMKADAIIMIKSMLP